jgi:hypothetical protein
MRVSVTLRLAGRRPPTWRATPIRPKAENLSFYADLYQAASWKMIPNV